MQSLLNVSDSSLMVRNEQGQLSNEISTGRLWLHEIECELETRLSSIKLLTSTIQSKSSNSFDSFDSFDSLDLSDSSDLTNASIKQQQPQQQQQDEDRYRSEMYKIYNTYFVSNRSTFRYR